MKIDFDRMTRKHEELRRRQKAFDALWERATDTSVKMSGMPHGGGSGNRSENVMIEIVAAEEACKETAEELAEMKRQLRRRMRRLHKWQHRDVIRKRYLEGKQIAQVATEIGYEWTQTNRYLNEAKAIINQGF